MLKHRRLKTYSSNANRKKIYPGAITVKRRQITKRKRGKEHQERYKTNKKILTFETKTQYFRCYINLAF